MSRHRDRGFRCPQPPGNVGAGCPAHHLANGVRLTGGRIMQSSLLASGLGFPEGQRSWVTDGSCSVTGTLVSYWPMKAAASHVRAYRRLAMGNGLGDDGAIYVTQGGNVPGSGDASAVSGIQRVNPDGTSNCCSPRLPDISSTGRTIWPSVPTDGCTSPSQARSGTSVSTSARRAGCSPLTPQAAGRCCSSCPSLPERDRLRRSETPLLD